MMKISKLSKNILITMAIFSLVSMPYTPRVRAVEAPFPDIASHWGKEYINNTYNKRIVNGYPDGTFNPDGQITRAEMAVIIVKAMALDPIENPKIDFADAIYIQPWAAGYIRAAVDKGIIKGYPDGTFKPDDLISRAEISVMAIRAVGITDPEYKETLFADNDSIPVWAKGFIAKAYDLFILKGSNENGRVYFHPDDNATRAEACVIIDKMCISNDQIAPTIPTGLALESMNNTYFTIKWTASKDIIGVSGYRVFRNNILVADINQTTYTEYISQIEIGLEYNYEVGAYDASGNLSSRSAAYKSHSDTEMTLFNKYSGEPKVVYIYQEGDYPDYVRGSVEIQIFSKNDGSQATTSARDLKNKVSENWVVIDSTLTMFDTSNNEATLVAQDIAAKLVLGWTWEKRTPIEEAWKIPYRPTINGTTDLDKTITKYVNKINDTYIPDIKNVDNSIKKGSASRYYDAAITQGCLPSKYTITPVNRDQSIALIAADLSWNQLKIERLWQVCKEMSTKYGNVIDPRLLVAVIMQEGTGSFNTNINPSSPSSPGAGYIQPDFEVDLSKAFNNHILGKIWAYTNYSNQFKEASQSADNKGKQFTVNIDNETPPHTKVITYNGKGDLFEYTNNDVPRIRWDALTNQYVVRYGVYATDYNWCNNLRSIYEVMAGTGAADGYSEFLKANPIPWPLGLEKPTGSFVLTNKGTESTGKYGGYPMLNFVITP